LKPNSFVYNALEAGNTTSSPSKIFGQNWLDLGKIKAKFGKNLGEIWTSLIKFGQNQNLASPKHSISYGNECY